MQITFTINIKEGSTKFNTSKRLFYFCSCGEVASNSEEELQGLTVWVQIFHPFNPELHLTPW